MGSLYSGIFRKFLLAAIWLVSTAAWAQYDTATDIWDLANGLYVRGEAYYKEAKSQYRQFLEKFPDDPRADPATFRLAEIYRKQKDYRQALKLYLEHQKFKNSPSRPKVEFRTGQMYYFLEEYPRAELYLSGVYNEVEETILKNSAGFYLGRTYFDRKQYQKVVDLFQRLAKVNQNPFAPFVNYFLAESLVQLGRANEAAPRYKEASVSRISVAAESGYKAAEIYMKNNQYSEAYDAYRRLVEVSAGSPYESDAAFGMVHSLFKQKKYKDAIAAFEKYESSLTDTATPAAMLITADCNFEISDYKKALSLYKSLVKKYSKSTEVQQARYKICWSYFLAEDYTRSITSGLEFLKSYPAFPERSKIYFLLAESYHKQEVVLEALNRYQKVLDTAKDRDIFFQKALYKKGLCLFDLKSFGEAKQVFLDFSDKFDKNRLAPEALVRAAKCEIEIEEYSSAAKIYEKFQKKFPDDKLAEDVMFQLGLTYAVLNRYGSLLELYQKFEQRFSNNKNMAEVHWWLGVANEERKNTAEAMKYYNLVIGESADTGTRGNAKYKVAQIYHLEGRFPEAADLISSVLAEEPEAAIPSETHLWAADYVLDQGKYKDAIRLYQLYIKKFTGGYKIEKAYFCIGEACFQQELWDRALENFEKAMEFKDEWSAFARLKAALSLVKLGKKERGMKLLTAVARSENPVLEAQAYHALGEINFSSAEDAADSAIRNALYEKALQNYLKVDILYQNAAVRPGAMLRIGHIWEKRANPEQAVKEYRRLIEEYPETEQANTATRRINRLVR